MNNKFKYKLNNTNNKISYIKTHKLPNNYRYNYLIAKLL